MKIKNFLKQKIPKKILIFRNQLKYYLFYIYEFIIYYKLNLRKFDNDYKKNKIQQKNIKFISSRVFLNYFSTNSFQEESLKIHKKDNIYYVPSDAIEIFIKKSSNLIYSKKDNLLVTIYLFLNKFKIRIKGINYLFKMLFIS